MAVDVVEVVEMELKYSKRCGGLGLRPRVEEEVSCQSCVPKMAEFPASGKRVPSRLPSVTTFWKDAAVSYLPCAGKGETHDCRRASTYGCSRLSGPVERRTDRATQGLKWGKNPDLWLYRDRMTAILQRYMRLAMEVGRLPSLRGREFFRSRGTSYHISTFEDSVIVVHDIEKCLEKLDAFRTS
jgi:hypothetical protein